MDEMRFLSAVGWIAGVMLYLLLFGATLFLFRSLPPLRRRLSIHRVYRDFVRQKPSAGLMWLFGISPDSPNLADKARLLLGAGIGLQILRYTVWKRALSSLSAFALVWGWAGMKRPFLLFHLSPLWVICGAAILLLLVLNDRTILETIRKQRTNRIVKEIYLLCNQLLYYTGSKRNLHGKLLLCIPYTRTMRHDFRLLLNEWYQDAEQALQSFKRRLGTEEGYSFAETLNSLRLYENEAYYDLLRKRIQDYKDKLDLIRDSKKETASYLLFVLAGIPILNTFRLFVYPWVVEGQKLFDSLN